MCQVTNDQFTSFTRGRPTPGTNLSFQERGSRIINVNEKEVLEYGSVKIVRSNDLVVHFSQKAEGQNLCSK